MHASYKKLWALLKKRNMKQKDLMSITGLSQATIAKLRRCETVNSDVLVRICAALHCDFGDIMQIEEDVTYATIKF